MSVRPLERVRLGWARLRQLIGLAGIVGLALLIAAAVVLPLAWSTHKAFVRTGGAGPVGAQVTLPAEASVAAASTPPVSIELPAASEIPLLLTQMKQAATSNGLDWRAADYRIIAATAAQPASLEVRCSIKGPYPKLRRMLVALKDEISAFSLRAFSASRPNADTADIEAKLTLAVFLQDDASPSDESTPRSLPEVRP